MRRACIWPANGRTALNANGRLRGLSDPPLDPVGIGEAARLAQVLASQHPAVVICSPQQRAVATARAIGGAARVPVVTDARLHDRDYGPCTGLLRAEVERRYGSVDLAPGWSRRNTGHDANKATHRCWLP